MANKRNYVHHSLAFILVAQFGCQICAWGWESRGWSSRITTVELRIFL